MIFVLAFYCKTSLQNQKTFFCGLIKDLVCSSREREESSGELSNIKRRETTKEDGSRIISLVMKDPFITSTKVKKSLDLSRRHIMMVSS